MTTRELVLFDLDGTLTDSAPGIMESVQYAYAQLGIEAPDADTLRTFVGPPLHVSSARYGVAASEYEEFLRQYRVKFTDGGMLNNSVYPGIVELLDTLTARGMPMAVATSKPEKYARQILEHFGLAHYFRFIAGATMDGTRSAKADVIEHCLASLTPLLGQLPGVDRILMVGDREHDVNGARLHGIDTVGVSWGYALPGELIAHGAVAVIDKPQELLDLV